MRSFRDYRDALAAGAEPDFEVPELPSDAIEFQGDRAGFVSRAIAASIDVLIIVLVVFATMAALWILSYIINPTNPTAAVEPQDRVPSALALLIYGYVLNVLYWTVFWATSGRTVGNLIMGLRVVNRHGRHPRWAGAFVRALFCTVFPLGLAWAIVSGANRSVQDVVLRTSVIYDWVIGIPGLSSKAGSPRPSGRTT